MMDFKIEYLAYVWVAAIIGIIFLGYMFYKYWKRNVRRKALKKVVDELTISPPALSAKYNTPISTTRSHTRDIKYPKSNKKAVAAVLAEEIVEEVIEIIEESAEESSEESDNDSSGILRTEYPSNADEESNIPPYHI